MPPLTLPAELKDSHPTQLSYSPQLQERRAIKRELGKKEVFYNNK